MGSFTAAVWIGPFSRHTLKGGFLLLGVAPLPGWQHRTRPRQTNTHIHKLTVNIGNLRAKPNVYEHQTCLSLLALMYSSFSDSLFAPDGCDAAVSMWSLVLLLFIIISQLGLDYDFFEGWSWCWPIEAADSQYWIF